jgi:hypothetical protein
MVKKTWAVERDMVKNTIMAFFGVKGLFFFWSFA